MGVSDQVRRAFYRAVKPRLLHVFHRMGPETGLSLPAFENVGERLEDVYIGLGDLDGLRPVLRRMREVLGEARVPGEIRALTRMAMVMLMNDDHAAVSEIERALAELAGSGLGGEEPAWLAARLGELARGSYHGGLVDRAVALAGVALALAPTLPTAMWIMAYGTARQGRDEESLEAFERLIAAHPDLAGPYEGKASVLERLGRPEEAIETMGGAILRAPLQPRHRLRRANLLIEGGLLGPALTDLTVCVRLAAAEAAILADDPDADLDYVDTLPTRRLNEIAVITRLVVLDQVGRRTDAVLCAHETLVDPRVPYLRSAVQEWIDAGPSPAAILAGGAGDDALRPARCLVVLGEVDRAVEVLEGLRYRPYDLESYEATLGLLELLAVRHPDHAGVRRLLADVLLLHWRPRSAMRHLEAVLAARPGDWHALFLRGMARVTHAEGEDGLDEADVASTLLLALEDLAAAARAAPDGERRPRNALAWLFQLTMAMAGMREILVLLVEQEPYRAILDVFPGLGSVMERLGTYLGDLAPRQALAESDEQLGTARAEAAAAGLPMLAAQLDLMRADVVLRLSDVQRAMDHVGAAEAVLALFGTVPNTDHLPAWDHAGDRRFREEADRSGRDHLVVDLDHQEVWGVAHGQQAMFADLVNAEIELRLGDPHAALARLGEPARYGPAGLGRGARLLQARLLRDVGRHREALDLLEGMDDDFQAVTVKAAILRLQGQDAEAARLLEGLLARGDAGPGERATIAVNLADVLLHEDDPEAALAVLDGDRPAPGSPISLRIAWLRSRGRVLGELARPLEALADLREALELNDRIRGGLRAESDRIRWQAESIPLLGEAVTQAIAADRHDLLLELVERGRARAFVDGLALGHPLYGPEAARLAADVATARERRRLLLAVAANPEAAVGSASTSAEVVRLKDLGIDLNAGTDLDDGTGTDLGDGAGMGERIAQHLIAAGAAVRRLEQRLLRASLGERASLAGRVSSAGEIRAMLAAPAGQPAAVLAEFVADGPDPIVGVLAVTEEATAWSVEHLDGLPRHLHELSRPGDVLCLVPSGPLHDLSLHTMLVDERPLIERNPVCYLPSASVLALCRTRRADTGPRPLSALVLGDSQGDLPQARTEAVAVADLLGARPHLGEDAAAGLLRLGADAHDVVHIACHATFDRADPELSGILLADGRLSVEDVYDLRLNARLLVLSACESGRGAERPGDELMGLVRAFMYAGASSLVVSDRPVDDLSAALIMREFYGHWLAGAGPAAALARAQLTIRDMTCAEAIRRLESWTAGDTIGTRLERARLHARAGDLARAITLYESLLGAEDAPADLIRRQLRLLRFRAEAPVTVDYGTRPFADVRHWGAFMLVGDWRTH